MTIKTRNIFLVGILGGLLIAIILTVSQLQKQQDIRQRASQQALAHLTLVPATMNKSPNDEFDVQVSLDIGGEAGITGIELTMQFDRTKIQLLNRFSPTNAFSTVVNEPRSPTPLTEQITFTGTASPDNLVSSSVLVGTARFKGVGGGNASITFPRVNITKLGPTGFIQVGTHDTATITIAGPTVPPVPTSAPTSPPPTGVTLSPTPTPHPADMDRNRCVGRADYDVWKERYTFGTTRQGTFPNCNGDNTIDLKDFNCWFNAMRTLPVGDLCTQ